MFMVKLDWLRKELKILLLRYLNFMYETYKTQLMTEQTQQIHLSIWTNVNEPELKK